MNLSTCANHKQRKKIKNIHFPEEWVSLRRMQRKDLPYVLEIERLSFPNPWRETTFLGELQNHPVSCPYVVVHSLKNRVIGYIIFWHYQDEVQINNIAVHPDFRRMGIGEHVLRKVLEQARQENAKLVTLEVRMSNMAAISLYAKLGFRLAYIREGYYRNPSENAYVMILYLA